MHADIARVRTDNFELGAGLVRHYSYRFCKSDEERERWEQAASAKWIDHNGGGWTWHGMCGSAVGWRLLPPNA